MNCTVMLASSCEIASPQNLKQIERQSRAEAMEKGSQWQSAVELFFVVRQACHRGVHRE